MTARFVLLCVPDPVQADELLYELAADPGAPILTPITGSEVRVELADATDLPGDLDDLVADSAARAHELINQRRDDP